ncbi:hypothetical protein [Caballeronia sp. 15711]|uniref:hypothetical protein n=1 Tax=Caballeronia sp. 15711 TaxID=3391029 RepID=UPI0039E4EB51
MKAKAICACILPLCLIALMRVGTTNTGFAAISLEPIIAPKDEGPCEPSDEDRKIRLAILQKYREEIDKRHFAASDGFDKAILTYASAGLGLSLTLFKDFIPHTAGKLPWLLPVSWGLLTVSILLVVASYVLAQKTLLDQLMLAEKYLKDFDEASNRKSRWERYSNLATAWAGITFGFGVIATVCLAVFNVSPNLSGDLSLASQTTVAASGSSKRAAAPVAQVAPFTASEPSAPRRAIKNP